MMISNIVTKFQNYDVFEHFLTFVMNVAIQSEKIKGFRANADVWTPVFYFYGINRIGSLI